MDASFAKYPLPLRLLIAGRVGVAAIALFAPQVFAKIFRMETAGTPAVALGRMFAVRNAVLAGGLLRLTGLNFPGEFIKANIAIDLIDAAALTAAGRRHEVSTATAILGTGAALTGAVYGVATLLALASHDATPTPAPSPDPTLRPARSTS
jgi:hypothetical protein